MGKIRIREFTQVSRASRIDRERGVLYGLVILGPRSANGRFYGPDVMRRALPLYEGRPSNANHVVGRGEPSVYDRLGVWHNVRVENGKIRGEFHAFKSHPLYTRLLEAAERPELHTAFGFSHDAEGSGHVDSKGTEIIESIDKVHSIDLVGDPASVSGLYESHNRRNAMTRRSKFRRRENSRGPMFDDPNGLATPGGSSDDAGEDADDLFEAAYAILQTCLDAAGPRHDAKFKDDLQEILELMEPWVTEEADTGDNQGSADDQGDTSESRRRGRGFLLTDSLRKSPQTVKAEDEARKDRCRKLRSGTYGQ